MVSLEALVIWWQASISKKEIGPLLAVISLTERNCPPLSHWYKVLLLQALQPQRSQKAWQFLAESRKSYQQSRAWLSRKAQPCTMHYPALTPSCRQRWPDIRYQGSACSFIAFCRKQFNCTGVQNRRICDCSNFLVIPRPHRC